MISRKITLFFLVITMTFGSSCSYFKKGGSSDGAAVEGGEQLDGAEPEVGHTAGDAVVDPQEEEESRATSTIELLWAAPKGKVDFYHIRYGVSPYSLVHHIKVPIKEIEEVAHPKQGLLFRYTLDVEVDARHIYFTLQAENRAGMSDESDVNRIRLR